MKPSTLVVLLALVLVLVDLAAQGGGATITGRVLVRERENGDHSLLVTVESPDKVSRIQINLPAKFSFVPGWVPTTWKFSQDGKKLLASGDSSFRVNLRFDVKQNEDLIKKLQGKELELEAGTASGQGITRINTKVEILPRIRFRDDWARLVALTFPPEVTPGAPIFGTPAPDFTGGVWLPEWKNVEDSLSRAEAALRRAEALVREGRPQGRRELFHNLNFEGLIDTGSIVQLRAFEEPPTSFTYYDQWLEKLAVERPEWKEVPAAKCDRAITGGTPMAFAGKDACLSGCFPAELGGLEEAAKMLMLDDELPLVPQAGSPTTIVVRIPSDTKPGPHFITWNKEGGAATGRLQLNVFQLEGNIDQNQLWKGQSTTMRLRIVGSDQSIPLNIINRTPSVIQVEGGEQQTIPSPGGVDNAVTRQVRGIMKGDFSIDYALDQPACGAGR